MGERLLQHRIENLEVAALRLAAAGPSGEDAVEALAQTDGRVEGSLRSLRARSLALELAALGLVEEAGLAAESQQVAERPELVGLGARAVPPAVDEIEAEPPARELERPGSGRCRGRHRVRHRQHCNP